MEQEAVDILKEIRDAQQSIAGQQVIANRLWGAQDIASYLGMSKASVRNRIISCPTFPPSIRLPSGDGLSHPKWEAKDVRKWVQLYKG